MNPIPMSQATLYHRNQYYIIHFDTVQSEYCVVKYVLSIGPAANRHGQFRMNSGFGRRCHSATAACRNNTPRAVQCRSRRVVLDCAAHGRGLVTVQFVPRYRCRATVLYQPKTMSFVACEWYARARVPRPVVTAYVSARSRDLSWWVELFVYPIPNMRVFHWFRLAAAHRIAPPTRDDDAERPTRSRGVTSLVFVRTVPLSTPADIPTTAIALTRLCACTCQSGARGTTLILWLSSRRRKTNAVQHPLRLQSMTSPT